MLVQRVLVFVVFTAYTGWFTYKNVGILLYVFVYEQLQQKQVRAALKMELPLSQKECALAVSHHNQRRRQQAGLIGRTSTV